MKKGKLIGKIFGIALVFVVIGVMLSGLLGSVADAEIQTALDEEPLHELPATSGKIMVMMKKARLP